VNEAGGDHYDSAVQLPHRSSSTRNVAVKLPIGEAPETPNVQIPNPESPTAQLCVTRYALAK
jgi:hypothetical protein